MPKKKQRAAPSPKAIREIGHRSHGESAKMLYDCADEIERLRERISYMGAVCESVHEIGEAALKGE
jgi:hypothetical protein